VLGPISLLIGYATGPITRRFASESPETYHSILRGDLRARPDLLLVGLAWVVALIPWFLLCLVIDALGALLGQERGWFAVVTFAGIAAITVAAVYYGLRAYLAREPISVHRGEDAVPVLAFVAVAAITLVIGGG
jgi:hypothetical protein